MRTVIYYTIFLLVFLVIMFAVYLGGAYLVAVLTPELESTLEAWMSTQFSVFVVLFVFIGRVLAGFITEGLLLILMVNVVASFAVILPLTLLQNTIGARGFDRGGSRVYEEVTLLILVVLKYILIACCAVAVHFVLTTPNLPISTVWLGLNILATPASTAPVGLVFPLLVAALRFIGALEDGRVQKRRRARGFQRKLASAEAGGPEKVAEFLDRERRNEPFFQLGNIGGLIVISIAIFVVTASFSIVYSAFFIFSYFTGRASDWLADRIKPGAAALRAAQA